MYFYYPIELDPLTLVVTSQDKQEEIKPNTIFRVPDYFAPMVYETYKRRGIVVVDLLKDVAKGNLGKYLLEKKIEGYTIYLDFLNEQWDEYMKSQEQLLTKYHPVKWVKDTIGNRDGLYSTNPLILNPKPRGKECLLDIVQSRIDELQDTLDSGNYAEVSIETINQMNDSMLTEPVEIHDHSNVDDRIRPELDTTSSHFIKPKSSQAFIIEEDTEAISDEEVTDLG